MGTTAGLLDKALPAAGLAANLGASAALAAASLPIRAWAAAVQVGGCGRRALWDASACLMQGGGWQGRHL